MSKANSAEFDDLILSRARLGIVSALLGGDELEFTYLRKALELSDGNLSVQICKLEEAGYIKVKKVFVGLSSSNPLSRRFLTTFAPPKSLATRASISTSTICPGSTLSWPEWLAIIFSNMVITDNWNLM